MRHTQKNSFLFTTSPVLFHSLLPKNKQRQKSYSFGVPSDKILFGQSGSRSNGSIKGEEREGDSWPWTNYLNTKASWESHRCPRLDDELRMCALCVCAFCLFWPSPPVRPWRETGISRVGDGKRHSPFHISLVELDWNMSGGFGGGWLVVLVLVVLMSSASKKLCKGVVCVL